MELDAAIKKAQNEPGKFDSIPRLVALGPQGMWFMVNAFHQGSWDLKGNLPNLNCSLYQITEFSGFQERDNTRCSKFRVDLES